MDFAQPLTALIVSFAAWIGLPIEQAREPRPMVQRMVIEDEIIIHVPIAQSPMRTIEWVERRGPKCVPAAMIAGAAMVAPSSIDFVMRDRRRVRARFDTDCAGLDFYGGFYIEPQDNALCAERDEIRSRAGSSCRIEGFRSLQAKYKR